MSNLNLYGTIGYTILKHPITNQQIIIFADRHDNLPHCNNKTDIADWFKEKMYSSKILLEEVPRESVQLEELWTDSEHTQDLKNLFLDNSDTINGLDIRPLLIPFSWELAADADPAHMISMREYCKKIDGFFMLANTFLQINLPNYNFTQLSGTKLGKHFLQLKNIFKKIVETNSGFLTLGVPTVKNLNQEFLEQINNLLDQIMEWHICACICVANKESVIVHAGLAHTEQVIWLLENHYGYSKVTEKGTNKLSNVYTGDVSGCVLLPVNTSKQFGGLGIKNNYIDWEDVKKFPLESN